MRLSAARRSLLLAAAAAAAGCDKIPGTQSFAEEKAKRAVAEQLLDPASALFRNVVSEAGKVCGEVNAKNKMGAYTGFSRFVVDTADFEPQLDPQFDLSDLWSARDLCREMMSNEYSSLSSTTSVCARVDELQQAEGRQRAFDRAWTASCESGATRQVYRPPLADTPAADTPAAPPPPKPETVPPPSEPADLNFDENEGAIDDE
jgi:hypothetical protein